MINIGIFGANGKMGETILDEIKKNDYINLQYDYIRGKNDDFIELFKSDIVIDFSSISGSLELIKQSIIHKKKIICGTTGFSKTEFNKIIEASNMIPIFYSANMSIGIFLLKNILKSIKNKIPSEFDIDIIDIHHKHKKDSPSGTALMLQNIIGNDNIKMSSIRSGEAYGTHEILLTGNDEQIKISHQACSRKIFARGAIKAAYFLNNINQPGLYGMEDLINKKL